MHQVSFSELAISYLQMHGFEAIECQTEDEARSKVPELIPQSKWPCYFFKSDTAGEKPYEEFYTANDTPDFARYKDIGVIKSYNEVDYAALESVKKHFLNSNMLHLAKEQVLELVRNALLSFSYIEYSNLDQKCEDLDVAKAYGFNSFCIAIFFCHVVYLCSINFKVYYEEKYFIIKQGLVEIINL